MGKTRRILITSVQVPFTRGGAEVLVERLRAALENYGTTVDVVQLPFTAVPKKALLKSVEYWRNLDLTSFNGQKVDLVIGTKFPSYFVRHPQKITWLIHQYRQIYDLYGTRFGDLSSSEDDEALRQILAESDRLALQECTKIFTISDNVTARLNKYCGLAAETIVPPLPLGNRYFRGAAQPYILAVGRICSIKRLDLMIRALAMVDERLSLKVVGSADESQIEAYLKSELAKHHLNHRVEWLGNVSDQALLELYAHAFLTYYGPFDEDLGFVTLESLASGVPVVTCLDSGGSLAFIEQDKNGLVVAPQEAALAEAINELFNDSTRYARLKGAAKLPDDLADWPSIVARMIG